MDSTQDYRDLEPEDDSLLGSLHNIMDALKAIWSPNLYIIRDFTDHGKGHSDRVLKHAISLLNILRVNTGGDLSEVERYLLLASIYLHDIGMQCDVVKFPHIKEIAESLGAEFDDIVFNAEFSSEYSIDAQEKIRKNHQYLTAAWIEYAFKNQGEYQESGFDALAKSIPDLLVQNLMDICMYHSGSTNGRVLKPCQYNRSARIPLIAALLRFADELDADLYRVPKPENFHKNFRLHLDNIKHWWLNGRTHIYIVNEEGANGKIKGKITFEVLLHPDDSREYGSLLQKIIIDKFKIKNEATLKLLMDCGIPIIISEDSQISESAFLERIPTEILEELTTIR